MMNACVRARVGVCVCVSNPVSKEMYSSCLRFFMFFFSAYVTAGAHATITQRHANEATCEWWKPRLITSVYLQFVFQDFCSTVDKLFSCAVTSTRTSMSR